MLTLAITRGYTMTANVAPSVDDWNAAFLPNATLDGFVGGADISDDAISYNHLGAQVFNGLTTLAALAVGDKLPVYDLSATDNAAVTVAVLINGVFSLAATAATAFTSYTADKFTLHNGTAAVTMSPAILAEQLVAQAPALTTVDVADEVLVHDASDTDGSRAKRVPIANILPAVGTPGTYTNVTGLTTDSSGRVTAVTTTGSGQIYSTADGSLVSLPTSAGSAGQIVIPHGLSAKPRFASVSLVCTDAGGNAGHVQNKEVEADAVVFDDPTGDYNSHYVVSWDATNIIVMQPDQVAIRIAHGTTGVMTAFDPTKWKARGFAIR